MCVCVLDGSFRKGKEDHKTMSNATFSTEAATSCGSLTKREDPRKHRTTCEHVKGSPGLVHRARTERCVQPRVPGDTSRAKEYVLLSPHRQRLIARLNLCLISNGAFILTEETPRVKTLIIHPY